MEQGHIEIDLVIGTFLPVGLYDAARQASTLDESQARVDELGGRPAATAGL
jgi:hypothetical protein